MTEIELKVVWVVMGYDSMESMGHERYLHSIHATEESANKTALRLYPKHWPEYPNQPKAEVQKWELSYGETFRR